LIPWTIDKRNKDILFGGKVVVFGGDFRKILPVILKGIRQEVVILLLIHLIFEL